MRKQVALGAAALFFAVGAASTDPLPRLFYHPQVLRFTTELAGRPAPVRSAAAYPICRSRSDDRCIQVRGAARETGFAQAVRRPSAEARLRYANVFDSGPLLTQRTGRERRTGQGGPLIPVQDRNNRPSDPIGL